MALITHCVLATMLAATRNQLQIILRGKRGIIFASTMKERK